MLPSKDQSVHMFYCKEDFHTSLQSSASTVYRIGSQSPGLLRSSRYQEKDRPSVSDGNSKVLVHVDSIQPGLCFLPQ